jgi:hypothetical protein
MTTSTISLNHLESVTRNGDIFTARYEWQEEITGFIAVPVYTGNVSINGKLNTSRTLKDLRPTVRKQRREEIKTISRDEAVHVVNAAKITDMLTGIERFDDEGKRWVARFKM